MAERHRAGRRGPKRSRPRAQRRHRKKKGPAAVQARRRARRTAQPRPGAKQLGQPAVVRTGSDVSATPNALATFDPQRLQSTFLQFGLAFVFLYASVSALIDPTRFTTYMPEILPASWIETVGLPCFSIFKVILAVWLLVGRRLFVPSMMAAATVAGIILVNLDLFAVLFRNVAVLCAAPGAGGASRGCPLEPPSSAWPRGRRHAAGK